MFDNISQSFKNASLKLQGKSILSEDNIKEAVKEIRKGLLEADVEYGVAKNFLVRVEAEAIGKIVHLKAGSGRDKMQVSPREHFINICQKELENLMGPVNTNLIFATNRPTTIMMVGLQGTGKTTTTAKLARYLKENKNRKPLLVAADIYRPAAVQQLRTLGERLGVPVYHAEGISPVKICEQSVDFAFKNDCDTIIFDTAGRLTIDEALMEELRSIRKNLNPDNTLLVCDAMMGQDAVTTAKAFDEKLELSGFIMTKLDGDARGGAALSIKEVTHKPIKFLGMGEGLDKLEEFRPEGLASRILGKGDVIGLMNDFERVVDRDVSEDAMKILQGQFTFDDFFNQISMIQKMGSLKDLIAKMPMQNMIPKEANLDDKQLSSIKDMISSMTAQEKLRPEIINESRARRISRGSGHTLHELQELVKRFRSMRAMMGSLGKNMGIMGKIPGMGALKNIQNLRNMSKQMQSGGGLSDMMGSLGMEGMPGMPGLGANPFGAAGAVRRPPDRDKLKKLRKAAKVARKKNRKK